MKEKIVENELQTQSLVITAIWTYVLPKSTPCWSKMLDKLSRSIYNFTTRYLSNTLPNGTNAKRKRIKNSSTCTHYGELESLGHCVGECSSAFKEGRYNWCHDSVIKNLALALSQKSDHRVSCDMEGFQSPAVIATEDYRPGIVVITEAEIFIAKLMVGIDTNICKNEERKQSKYTDIFRAFSNRKSQYGCKWSIREKVGKVVYYVKRTTSNLTVLYLN